MTMRFIDAGDRDYLGDVHTVVFDGVECAGKIQRMLVADEPDNPVKGWAEFAIEVNGETRVNNDGSVMKEWLEGIIEWGTKPNAVS